MSERCHDSFQAVRPEFGTLIAKAAWSQPGISAHMITLQVQNLSSTRMPSLSHLAACLAILSATAPAFGADQTDGKRHSLILRPVAGHVRAMASGLSSVGQIGLPSTVPPTTSSTASPPHKLAKYPNVERTFGVAAAQTPIAASARQTQPLANPIQTTQSIQTQQTQGPGSVGKPSSAVLLSNAAKATPIAATAPAKAAHQPIASVVPTQPIAASGTGPSSGYGGSRAAINLFNIRGLVNLIQAPLPPVVTQASNPSTPPKSTPQTAPEPASNPRSSTPTNSQPNPSSNHPAPSSQGSNPPPSQSPGTPPPAPKTGNAILSWNLGTEKDLAGYKVYIGTASGAYSYPGSPFTIGRVTTYTVNNLPMGQTYYFALSAYDNAGNTSAVSAEVHKSIY